MWSRGQILSSPWDSVQVGVRTQGREVGLWKSKMGTRDERRKQETRQE